MRRLPIAIITVIALLGASGGAVSGAQAASPRASCVALITRYEATQLPAGSVGIEVSGLASSSPGLGSALVSPLALNHLGSTESCSEAEG
jgi:hypothetical protein